MEREQKKKDKENLRLNKQSKTGKANARKKTVQKGRKTKGTKRKRVEIESEDSGSEDIPYQESDEELLYEEEREKCLKCAEGERAGHAWTFVACEECNRWWHIICTGDPDMLNMNSDELEAYPFICLYCEMA
jgi:hypothetical protein